MRLPEGIMMEFESTNDAQNREMLDFVRNTGASPPLLPAPMEPKCDPGQRRPLMHLYV